MAIKEVVSKLLNKRHENTLTSTTLIQVEVVYASVNTQQLYVVELSSESTIAAAVIKSGVLEDFPEINLASQKVGIFSQPRSLQDRVFAGDRIEIYRPLLADPKERRRNKVKANAKNNGFSLIEVLIAMTLISVSLLGLLTMAVKFMRLHQESYYTALAQQQVDNLFEMLRDNVSSQGNSMPAWNEANEKLLPNGQGKLEHNNQNDTVILTWASRMKQGSDNQLCVHAVL